MTKTNLIFSRDTEFLLKELGIGDLPDKDKKEVLDALFDHFNKVIIETAILNLDDEGVKKFKAALRGRHAEDEIASLCAGVPGLAEKIEEAVENEFQLIKAAKNMTGK
ncbi:MAG: hypothetical protein HY434_02745 [Candidatus Liptonbacteria bacterium]|nr:hypothetical protein [Candidatus Liptonbacteria bacterium]